MLPPCNLIPQLRTANPQPPVWLLQMEGARWPFYLKVPFPYFPLFTHYNLKNGLQPTFIHVQQFALTLQNQIGKAVHMNIANHVHGFLFWLN